MAVEFRCEQCGKLLSVEAEPGQKVKCPHCKRSTAVPEGLAGLPRPKVQASAAAGAAGAAGAAKAPSATPSPPPAEAAEDEEPEEEEETEGQVFVSAMARLMPFVISVFFHLGVALIFFLITMVAVQTGEGENLDIVVPDAVLSEDPGGMLTKTRDSQQSTKSRQPSRVQSVRESPVAQDSGKVNKPMRIGAASASGGAGDSMMKSGGGGGPVSSFFGSGGRAYHICYVVDRSGSMMDTFNLVQLEMIKSIGKLKDVQDFHVLFFNDGPPLENPPGKLVPATAHNVRLTGQFLQRINASGQTDPIPALERAFAVLARADASRRGKLIYLLTDGVFPNNDRVKALIASKNRDKSVHINTYLYGGGKSGEGEVAAGVLREIAKANDGRFRYVGGAE